MESSEKCRPFRSDTSGGAVVLPSRAEATATLPGAGRAGTLLRSAIQRCPAPAACTSVQNADVSVTSTRLARVTHPFHPLSGQSCVCVGERYNRYGTRLLLQGEDGSIHSIPPHWTDLVDPDPEVVFGRGRALFRVADLVDLAGLLARLRRRKAREVPDEA